MDDFDYFRFEGSVADEIPDACIAIDRGALEKKSLLSAMLNPSWNSKQLGGREEIPSQIPPRLGSCDGLGDRVRAAGSAADFTTGSGARRVASNARLLSVGTG